MSYFNFLPSIYYRQGNFNSPTILAKNILTRGKIHDFLKETAAGSLEYTIKDEEKPETLAARVYGRPDYHWIILLFNEIHDPFFKWPMSINEMENHLKRTYVGQSLYIDPFNIFDIDSRSLLDKKFRHFDVDDVVERKDHEGNVVASARIVSWEPTLYRLTIDDIVGSFVGDSRETSIIYSTTKTGKKISAPVVRVTTENQYALHHFENLNGETISPLYRPKTIQDGKTLENPGRIIDRFVFGGIEKAIPLGTDAEGNSLGVANSVTNIEYEERANDAKRKIRVMRPEMIDPLLVDFRRLFLVNRT
jgi:hypothetical protein